ncbi:MAG: HAD family hydrolase, partial [Terriglobales bacterium]
MPTFKCSAILFDLDGVLVDSTPSVTRQWSLWAKENHIDPKKAVEIVHGRRTIESVRLLAPHLDAEAETKK